MPVSFLRALVYLHLQRRRSSPLFATYQRSMLSPAQVSWSPRGNVIAVSNYAGVQLRDANDGTLLHWWENGPVEPMAWSPDGTAIVAFGLPDRARVDEWTLQIWDVETGACRCTYREGGNHCYALAWSPDGNRIAHSMPSTPDNNGHIHIWDAATGSPLVTYLGHSNNSPATSLSWSPPVTTLSWSPDSAFLVSGDTNDSIQIWRSTDGTLVRPLAAQGSGLGGHALWSPDGTRIATDLSGSQIHLWNADTGELLTSYRTPQLYEYLSPESWSPDGKMLALLGGDLITVVESRTGKRERDYSGHLRDKPLLFTPPFGQYGPTSLSWSPDGTRMASVDQHGHLHVWQVSIQFPWLP